MPIAHLLKPHTKELSPGFTVRRSLPAGVKQAVGPFLFFDHFGPVTARPGDNHDVRPHPHIGLATVTYLFEGAMMHRDSIGVVQKIEPGAINWMTAGRGIVHSERTPEEMRGMERRSHGLQLWVGLPASHEEVEPSFAHTPAGDIPEFAEGNANIRVLIGELAGHVSPVATLQPTLYLDINAQPGARITLPATMAGVTIERGVYALSTPLVVDGEPIPASQLAVIDPGADAIVEAPEGGRFVVIGGEPLDGHRFMWWNFVSSRKERIEEAKAAWTAQRMGQIPGETEWIPLP
jgi:redox-sensitive bicupin YhaK (pirin superfamily)